MACHVLSVRFNTAGGKRLGLAFLPETTLIKLVLEDGAIAAWNRENHDLISPGAEIMEVNGKQGPEILTALKAGGELSMVIELHCDKKIPKHLQPKEAFAKEDVEHTVVEAAPEAEAAPQTGIINIAISTRQAQDPRLGIQLESATSTVIKELLHFGALYEWNMKNGEVIRQGARIEEVNGARGADIHPLLRAGGELKLKINLTPGQAEATPPPREAAKAQPKPEPKVETAAAAKPEAKPQPDAKPKAAMQPEAKPEPTQEAKPEKSEPVKAEAAKPEAVTPVPVKPEPVQAEPAKAASAPAAEALPKTAAKKKPNKKGKQ